MNIIENSSREEELWCMEKIFSYSPSDFDFLPNISSWNVLYVYDAYTNKDEIISQITNENIVLTEILAYKAAMILILAFEKYMKTYDRFDFLHFYYYLKCVVEKTNKVYTRLSTDEVCKFKSPLSIIINLQRSVYNAQLKMSNSKIYTTRKSLRKKTRTYSSNEFRKITTNVRKIVNARYSEYCNSICERINPRIADELKSNNIDLAQIMIDAIIIPEVDQQQNATKLFNNLSGQITDSDIESFREAVFREFAKLSNTRYNKVLKKYVYIDREGSIRNANENYTNHLIFLSVYYNGSFRASILEDLLYIKDNMPVLEFNDVYRIINISEMSKIMGDDLKLQKRHQNSIKKILNKYNALLALKFFKLFPISSY